MTRPDSTGAGTRSTTVAGVIRGPRFVTLATVAGALAGVIAKWADENGPGWLGDLGTDLPFWVALAAAIGWFARSRARAAVASALFFLAMTAAYYAWAAIVLRFPFESSAAIWFALAAVVCPFLSVAMNAARSRMWTGPMALGAAAALVAATGSLRRLWLQLSGALGEESPDQLVQGALTLAIAVGLVLLARSPRSVTVAAVTAVLLFWPVEAAYDAVSARVPLP